MKTIVREMVIDPNLVIDPNFSDLMDGDKVQYFSEIRERMRRGIAVKLSEEWVEGAVCVTRLRTSTGKEDAPGVPHIFQHAKLKTELDLIQAPIPIKDAIWRFRFGRDRFVTLSGKAEANQLCRHFLEGGANPFEDESE